MAFRPASPCAPGRHAPAASYVRLPAALVARRRYLLDDGNASAARESIAQIDDNRRRREAASIWRGWPLFGLRSALWRPADAPATGHAPSKARRPMTAPCMKASRKSLALFSPASSAAPAIKHFLFMLLCLLRNTAAGIRGAAMAALHVALASGPTDSSACDQLLL